MVPVSGLSRLNQRVTEAVASYERSPALASLLGTVTHVRGADTDIPVDSLCHTYRRRRNRLPAGSRLRQEVEALPHRLDELDGAPVKLVTATGGSGATTLVLLDRRMGKVLFWSPMWVAGQVYWPRLDLR
ncbi:hypothetical protein GCM10022227_12740 [Streptomyces sedi]